MENFERNLSKAIASQDLWLNFETGRLISNSELLRLIKSSELDLENVSSQPEVFPVFGDMKGAVQALHKLVEGEDLEDVSSIEYDCHQNVRGLRNLNNSCFMDSTLMCMFFLQNSPFYNGLLNVELDERGDACSSDPQENFNLKEEVQAIMKEDVDRILNGGVSFACTKLRNIIGKTCRGRGVDMSRGMHDAAELYQRVCNVLGYEPIITQAVVSNSSDEFGPFEGRRFNSPVPGCMLNVDVRNPNGVKWPTSWETIIQSELDSLWYKTETKMLKAEVIVVQVSRRNWESPDETAVLNTPIEVDETMVVELENGEKRLYNLMAAVYPPGPKHYAAILKCGDSWRRYDDLQTAIPYEKNVLKQKDAMKILMEKAVLLFFF